MVTELSFIFYLRQKLQVDTLCLLLFNLQICPGPVSVSMSHKPLWLFHPLEILKTLPYTCDLGKYGCFPNKPCWWTQNYSTRPHRLEFLSAVIQIAIQNSKRTISITMRSPAGDRTFFCKTSTKAIIIVIYIMREKYKTLQQRKLCLLHCFINV